MREPWWEDDDFELAGLNDQPHACATGLAVLLIVAMYAAIGFAIWKLF